LKSLILLLISGTRGRAFESPMPANFLDSAYPEMGDFRKLGKSKALSKCSNARLMGFLDTGHNTINVLYPQLDTFSPIIL